MGNLKKTLRYLKRNGIVNTGYAVSERLLSKKGVPYSYANVCEEERNRQIKWYKEQENPVLISILVPLYETPVDYLKEMIESCLSQTYGHFELVLADASSSDNLRTIVNGYTDKRIKYVHLKENKGISLNTNEALYIADGEYCALLDHDDLLTEDALYENAVRIMAAKEQGKHIGMLFSDEDKTDSEGKSYFEPHFKKELNLDLFLSNNYICHFAVIESSIIKKLEFREQYDGSQDYDMFLRTIGMILFDENRRPTNRYEDIVHIPKVLYHWRCHEASTAFDPASKEYAYSAGKRAIKSFVNTYYGKYDIQELAHKGFYRVEWKNIFDVRPEVGAIGGMLYSKNRFVAGMYAENGKVEYLNMNRHFSGYMNRASLQQQVYCLDIRGIEPSDTMKTDYDEIFAGLNENSTEQEYAEASLLFAQKVREKGLVIVYDPIYNKKI